MDKEDIPQFASGLEFVALDIETTGLNAERDEIIELAAIRFAGGVETERFSTLVRPRKGVPKFIEFLTHITADDLRSAPELKDALSSFHDFVGESVLVGHNIAFDLSFIDNYSILCDLPVLRRKTWDTAEISRVYLPYTANHQLGTMVKYFGIELLNAHRAAADAEATGLLLVKMSQYILRHFPLLVNARLLDLSKQAQLTDGLYHFLYRVVEYQRKYALIGSKTAMPDVAKQNVVEHELERPIKVGIEKVFSSDGIFAERFPKFEFRSGQLEMANEVAECFRNSIHLAVEAGTGVGKSFAYLVPAIAFSHEHKTKVVVSTNTKNLQEQLFYKDLPQLKELLPLPFKAALVKGRENYVCERRWGEFLMEQTRGISPYEASALLHLFIWKYLTKSGDVSENSSFDKNRFSIAWRKVCSDRFLCMGRKCPHASQCYVMTLRKHIETSSLVVTNHSLLLADLRMENTTLGEYQYLVVDEAHNLMSTAAKNLGFDVGYTDVLNLINQLSYSYKKKNSGFTHQLEQIIAKSLVSQGGKDHLSALCKNATEVCSDIRKELLDLFSLASQLSCAPNTYGKQRIKHTEDYPIVYEQLTALAASWKLLMKELQALSNLLNSFNSKTVPNYEQYTETLNSLIMRTSEMEDHILTLINPDLDNHALWIESGGRLDLKTPSSSFCYAPVDVSEQLNDLLYKSIPSIVFTSATLALRGSFKYFFTQSGLRLVPPENIRASIVDSPFDYATQSSLIIGSFLPEHKDKFFINQALGCVEQLVTATNVGTMILFTSYKDLNSVYDHISETLYHNKRPFFAQGKTNSRSSILEEFKRYNNAVLLGTNSFWEGVDIQGESLSLLILFKIPFQVPSEPLVEALIDKLERENKDSFMHFMLPNALLKLRQGFGRLIRSKTDRGVVLIMDSRVSNKPYGEYFKQILPGKCKEAASELELLTEISRFFNIS